MKNSLMRWHLARDNQAKLAKFCEQHKMGDSMTDKEKLIKRDIANLKAKKLNLQSEIGIKTHTMIALGGAILKKQSELHKLRRRKVAK